MMCLAGELSQTLRMLHTAISLGLPLYSQNFYLGLGLKMFVSFLGCLLLTISWIDQITTFKVTVVTGNALSSLVIIGDPPERQGVVAGWLAGGPVGDRAG